MRAFGLGLALAVVFGSGTSGDPPDERLYGRVHTTDGVVLEGYLLWDRNEAAWSDFLDGLKEVPYEHVRQAESLDPELARRAQQERSLEAFGVRVTWDRDDIAEPEQVTAAVRFAHIRTLTVVDRRRARLELMDGTEVVLAARSSDLGPAMRGLIVWTAGSEEREVEWEDLERVEFLAAPGDAPAPDQRLYGTLTTAEGRQLAGFVTWDLDESLASHELDGDEDDTREEWVIPMGDLRSIERWDDRRAEVVLRSGEMLLLRGTNDVDRDNRGIEITDPTFGRAIVGWGDFDRLTFHDPPADGAGRDGYGPTGPLRGSVHTRDGRVVSGALRWGNDEQAGWEVLSGRMEGVDYDVELGRVARLTRRTETGLVVELRDGRTWELVGTRDVGPDNPGVVVTPDVGAVELVRWAELERVVFAW